MLRIFLTTSHFNTALLTAYAQSTADGNSDYLLLDATPRRPEVAEQIRKAAGAHTWAGIVDLSEPVTPANEVPRFRKRLTNRLRGLPGFRQAYSLLHNRHMEKRDRRLAELLRGKIASPGGKKVELILLKETLLNGALHLLYPEAVVHYFEHGVSDYLFTAKHPPQGEGKFFCVFADGFRRYLDKRQLPSEYVRPITDAATFGNICSSYFSRQPAQAEALRNVCMPGRAYALLILQPISGLQIDWQRCWEGFIPRCAAKVPGNVHFIIKPHPLQPEGEIAFLKALLDRSGRSYTLLEGEAAAVSIEIAFETWKKEVNYVFSLYSSAVYYLSLLFPEKGTQYFHAYAYTQQFLGAAPEYYRRLVTEAGPMIGEFFSERCESL